MPSLSRNQKLVYTAMLAAITIVLVVTPLGYIPINPLVTVTIMVTPVVLGGFLFGLPTGLFLGLIFGVSSFLRAPTEALGQIMLAESGLLTALACIVPRLLIGLYAGLMHRLLRREGLRRVWFYALTGLLGSLVNTVFFLCFILVMFDPAKTGITGALVMGIVTTNGLMEAAANAFLVGALAKVLLRVMNRTK